MAYYAKLIFDPNGGNWSGSTSDIEYGPYSKSNSGTYTDDVTVSVTSPTRSNYTFKGWAKTASASSGYIGNKWDMTYSSTDYNNPTMNYRYAVWEFNGTTQTFYYRYRYLKTDNTFVADSSVYNDTSSSGFITVKFSDIPTYTGYSKTGRYSGIQYCSIGETFARCTSTFNNSPSIIGVYVESIYHEFWYKYKYTDSSGNPIKESSTMVATVAGDQYDQTLNDIPEPNTGRWIKSGTYWGGNACSINASSGYARCTSTVQSNPSVIGVYCEQKTIDRFTWTGTDSGDNSAFQSGKNIGTALTATRWNNFLAKIKEVAEANGGSFSYTNVGQERIKANATNNKNNGFNDAVNAINSITGHGTLPSTQNPGDTIYASFYVGNGSLKTALNAAINNYNNS